MSGIIKNLTKEKLQEIKDSIDISKTYVTYDKEEVWYKKDVSNERHIFKVYSLDGDKVYSFIINKIKSFNGGICMAFDNKSNLIAAETFLDSELNNTNSVLLNFINQLYWFRKQNSYMFDAYMMKNMFGSR